MHDIKINGAKNKLFDTKRVSQKLIDFATEEGFKIDKLEPDSLIQSIKMLWELNNLNLMPDDEVPVVVLAFLASLHAETENGSLRFF